MHFQEEETSPTARLQQLLTESRNMVKTLEDSHDLSSIRSSPDQLFLVSHVFFLEED